jgi:glycine dehydrogenase subunit 1
LPYTPHTADDAAQMLRAIGLSRPEELFKDIPREVRPARPPALAPALSEMELRAQMEALAARNASTETHVCFLGAGAYDHFIPAAVDAVASRGEFLTAYTPYQAEASQGTLQWIYEFQSMICALTEMPVANASHYDGATALAEAAGLAMDATGRRKLVVAGELHPHYRQVLRTYHDVEPEPADALDDRTAALIVQNPDFTGAIQDLRAAAAAAHHVGARAVAAVHPVALAVLQSPGEAGVDLAVGEGQPLGIDLQFGGPTVGFMAVSPEFLRRMPGRIVGQATDAEGRRAFVLTLQAREQHIRREKAFSNICTNTALMALRATIHMALLGPTGLRRAAEGSMARARELRDKVTRLPGVRARSEGPFFHEFVVTLPKPPAAVNAALLDLGFIGGLDLGADQAWLLCATERRTSREIDALVKALKKIL